ncbi:hypothetical protein RvY_12780 [Ramazzottius varieornatus]|uniref:Ubiquitin-conjugating enzyme E2 Z n=1 Tax=Ramazzottius varieornatus TaxID=947166 RepID=A0A1D1VPS2_RAMVA|nr:hypothetical protein RvY_12780 [Ramazzottius varieornatus]
MPSRKRKISTETPSQVDMNPAGAAKEEPSVSSGTRSSKATAAPSGTQPLEAVRQTRSMSKMNNPPANPAAPTNTSGRGKQKKQKQAANSAFGMEWNDDDDDEDFFPPSSQPFAIPVSAAPNLPGGAFNPPPPHWTPFFASHSLPPWMQGAPGSAAYAATPNGSGWAQVSGNGPAYFKQNMPPHGQGSAGDAPPLPFSLSGLGLGPTDPFTGPGGMFSLSGKHSSANPHQSPWDPRQSPDWDKTEASAMCKKRMQHDLANSLSDEDCMGIYIQPDEKNITKLHALVIGPKDTPYEGGFFLFFVRCPPDYPLRPPKVAVLTTGNGRVRFGPNLYNCGKVCLSILGTWTGPSWTAAMTMSVLLTSIRSLMSVGALRNEPSYENRALTEPAVIAYDRNVKYETIRVAVLDNLDIVLTAGQTTFSEKFCQVMLKSFSENCETIITLCEVEIQQQANLPPSTTKPQPRGYNPEMSYVMSVGGQYGPGGAQHNWKQLKDRLQAMKPRVRKALSGTQAPITIS